MLKEFFSAFAILLTFIAFIPYIRSIHQDKTKPHVFSWLIWGSTTFIVFLSQLADKGGVGAWPIGVSGVITLYIAFLAYAKKSDINITKLDWFFFLVAMSSLPLWFFTSDPLWAVIVLTAVDVVGFGPTFRKAYLNPFDEHVTFFTIMVVRNFVSIAALEHYSFTTVLFPAVIGLETLLFVVMVMYRRRILGLS